MQPRSLPLAIDPGNRLPIFRQIEEQIADAIVDRRLRPGDRLAASRALAEQLVTSPSTVVKAYRDLVAKGLCQSDEGGLRVCELSRDTRRRAFRRESVTALVERGFSSEELELAREVQRRLLPPPHIEGDGFSITARSLPARFVAGDFHDVIRHADGSIGLVVADVAGKGIASGLITASVKATLPFVAAEREAEEVLRELNRRLCSDLGPREFVALVYVHFHPVTGRLRIANAGMPSPYVLAAGEQPLELPASWPRLPLGLNPRLEYRAVETCLDFGDRLLLLSDGMPEARAGEGEPLGYERFAELLAANSAGGDARDGGDWLERLFSAVHREVAGTRRSAPLQEASSNRLTDDWTALLLDRRAGQEK